MTQRARQVCSDSARKGMAGAFDARIEPLVVHRRGHRASYPRQAAVKDVIDYTQVFFK